MEEQPLLRTIGASARLQTVINLDKERYEKYKKNTCGCIAIVFATCMYGQKNYKLTGKIISATNKPIADAVVSVQDTLNATTKADGEFTFKLRDKSGVISVWAPVTFPFGSC